MRWLLVLLVVMAGCAAAPGDPLSQLAEHARPVDDLGAFGDVVGDAVVVGVGEATHNSKDFFELKHRLFRYLVEEKGFTTFSLEVSWDIGLRLDDHVVHGRGDPGEILGQDPAWHTREYLDLVRWMRAHNEKNPGTLRFMGNDVLYPGLTGPTLDRVADHLRRHDPALLAEFEPLHTRLRELGTFDALQALPHPERTAIADRAASLASRLRDPWVARHARVVAQTTRMVAHDFDGIDRNPEKGAPIMRYRDQAMAENTAWWQRNVGGGVLLSAHNGHVAYESGNPRELPKLQGAFLRDRLGSRYVSVGLTFGQGAFNAQDAADPNGAWRPFTVGPGAPGSNEHTLDRVSDQDFLIDLRTVPEEARAWLRETRPAHDIGAAYPALLPARVALGRSFDAVVHLHRVEAARRLS